MNTTIEKTQPPPTEIHPAEAPTDEELLLAYRSGGDRGAFEQLVQRYETELYSYLRNYLGNAQMAEDAFQATFLQVHLKCDQFEPGRRVRPWLYTVATNQAIDAQRRNRRHRMVSLDRRRSMDGPDDEDGGTLMNLLDSRDVDPIEQFTIEEDSQAVRAAIEQLPESLRRVVLLVYFQGLKYREAADVLSIPVGTVKSRLHTAVARLNESLTVSPFFGHE
jgi:RNA polymerase sigma-70 factor (ECF subfamily)